MAVVMTCGFASRRRYWREDMRSRIERLLLYKRYIDFLVNRELEAMCHDNADRKRKSPVSSVPKVGGNCECSGTEGAIAEDCVVGKRRAMQHPSK